MPPPQRLKRPKVAMACDFCRRRKIKCDGKQPECGPCSSRKDPNLLCTWNDNRSRVDIRRLQRQLHELQQERIPGYIPGDGLPPSNPSECSPRRVSYPKPLDPDSPASAMLGPVELGSGTHGFFGGSSAGNFVARIRQAVAQQQASSSIQQLPSPGTAGIPSPFSSTMPALVDLSLSLPSPRQSRQTGRTQWPKLRLDDCALPPRRRADRLVSVYWDAVHPLYPFVDRVTVMRLYEQLFAEQAPCEIDSALLCTLNIIFALSCQLDTTAEPDQRRHSTQVFFDRAKRSLDLWKLPPSLESVQVLLLVAQYLQSTNEPLQCWNFVGSAIRMAESLGLHLKECCENAAGIREAEMMRRVWHGCVLLDRVSAMAYGRPTMINRAIAARPPLPIAIDEEELPDGFDPIIPQVPGKPSRLDFFIQSLGLYDILEEILTMLYANKERRDNASTKDRGVCHLLQASGASMIDIDGRLMAWEANLPRHLRQYEALRDDEQQSQSTVFLRQSVVLRQRFLHVRLLSLRPVLYSLISSSPSECNLSASFLAPRIAQHCVMICIQVAQEAIDLAFTHRDSTWATTGLLAAWWYNVLFVSSAASILLAARLLHALPELAISKDDIAASWTRAMSLLEGYKQYSASIPALIDTLELVFKEASSRCVLPAMSEPDIAPDANLPDVRTPLNGVMDLAQGNGIDWTTFLDPVNLSWLDSFPLEM